MRRFVTTLLISGIFFFPVFALAGKLRMQDVAGKLSCYCGGCPHLVVTGCTCPTADKIKADVQKKIDSGMSEKQILAAYVAQYGQTILSAPPKSGFNMTAWALPFLAFIGGGVFLISFLKKQRKREWGTAEIAQPDPEQDEYRKQLERELDERR